MMTMMIMFRLLRLSLISYLSQSNHPSNYDRCSTTRLSSYHNGGNHHQYQYQDRSYSNASPRPLKVALIGAGLMATGAHAPVLQQLSQANIRCVAVWSRSFDNAASLARKVGNGAMPTDSWQEILESPHIDAVILSTPIDVQGDMVLQALQAGKHVLSEKPLAVSMDQAHALVEEYEAAFEDKGLVWNVAGDYRYAQAVRLSHKAMDEIGKPFLVSLKVRAPFLKSSPFSEAMWRNQPKWYGGMIVEAFVHASSMLKRLFGPPLYVSAHTSSQTPHIPSLDTMTAQVTWDQNVQGTVSVTYASTQNEFELEVIGSQGRLVLTRLYETGSSGSSSSGGIGPNVGGNGNGSGCYRLSVENASNRYHQDIPFGGLDSDILAFSDSIQYGRHAPRFNTPQDALQDLELVDACLESGKLNGARIIMLPPQEMDPFRQQEYYHQHGPRKDEDAITVDHLTEDTAEGMTAWGTRHRTKPRHQPQPQQVYRNNGEPFLDDGKTKWHGKERLS